MLFAQAHISMQHIEYGIHGIHVGDMSQPYQSKHHNTKHLSSSVQLRYHLDACILIDKHQLEPLANFAPQGALSHGARTVRARCAHGSMFLGWLPNLYPLNGPHRNTPRVLIFAPCSPYWHTGILQFLV